jgi:hypothetical protein
MRPTLPLQQGRVKQAYRKDTLQRRSAVVTDLSLQLQALSEKIDGKGGAHAVGQAGLPLPASNAEYMKLVNSLQEQLFAEREKNKRLKGA